jgi:hypothetical protein
MPYKRFFIGWSLFLGGVSCGILMARQYDRPVHADSPQEVAPYKVTDIPQEGGLKLYKLVHQGCELFVLHQYNGHDDSIALATGRGCK